MTDCQYNVMAVVFGAMKSFRLRAGWTLGGAFSVVLLLAGWLDKAIGAIGNFVAIREWLAAIQKNGGTEVGGILALMLLAALVPVWWPSHAPGKREVDRGSPSKGNGAYSRQRMVLVILGLSFVVLGVFLVVAGLRLKPEVVVAGEPMRPIENKAAPSTDAGIESARRVILASPPKKPKSHAHVQAVAAAAADNEATAVPEPHRFIQAGQDVATVSVGDLTTGYQKWTGPTRVVFRSISPTPLFNEWLDVEYQDMILRRCRDPRGRMLRQTNPDYEGAKSERVEDWWVCEIAERKK